MQGRRKKYDPELAGWAERAEREARLFFKAKGYDVRLLPEGAYGPDLEIERYPELFFLEVERRSPRTWAEGSFPYATVHVPERRHKADRPVLLLVLRRDLCAGLIVFPQSLTRSRLVPVKTVYTPKGDELFYDVPFCEVLPIGMQAPTQETIAAMNVKRIRKAFRTCGNGRRGHQKRMKLLGLEPPYGMTLEEWRDLGQRADDEPEQRLFWGLD